MTRSLILIIEIAFHYLLVILSYPHTRCQSVCLCKLILIRKKCPAFSAEHFHTLLFSVFSFLFSVFSFLLSVLLLFILPP